MSAGYRIDVIGTNEGIRFDSWTPTGLPIFLQWDSALEIALEVRDATSFRVRVIGETGWIMLPPRPSARDDAARVS